MSYPSTLIGPAAPTVTRPPMPVDAGWLSALGAKTGSAILASVASSLLLSACGGSAPEAGLSVEADEVGRSSSMRIRATIPLKARIEAATSTANSDQNACSAVRPFYWEIGDKDSAKASGSVNSSSTRVRYSARTPLSYASASKWLYGAYVVQFRRGTLTDIDLQMLTLRSGYTSLKSCETARTVDACLAVNGNGDYNAFADGKFFYNGGHMEKHASLIGLGAMDNAGLTATMKSQLGSDLSFSFAQPQLAGGALGTPEIYARFLRKLLRGELLMGQMLGASAVCTNPVTCGLDKAILTPIPSTESWSYSLGHWVENDPVTGDGAFSSGGTLGFYPWIDVDRTSYGIVARVALVGGQPSADCGHLLRKAWTTGVAQ